MMLQYRILIQENTLTIWQERIQALSDWGLFCLCIRKPSGSSCHSAGLSYHSERRGRIPANKKAPSNLTRPWHFLCFSCRFQLTWCQVKSRTPFSLYRSSLLPSLSLTTRDFIYNSTFWLYLSTSIAGSRPNIYTTNPKTEKTFSFASEEKSVQTETWGSLNLFRWMGDTFMCNIG